MQALRLIASPTSRQLVIDLPPDFSSASRLEVIVLPVEEEADTDGRENIASVPVQRRPSSRLAGTRIVGDIMSPTVPESDWDALQ